MLVSTRIKLYITADIKHTRLVQYQCIDTTGHCTSVPFVRPRFVASRAKFSN